MKRSDANGFVKLARWARQRDLFEEQKDALALALHADPEHKRATRDLEKVLTEEARHRNYRTPWRREASVLFVETNTTQAKLYYYCDTVSAFYRRFSKIFRVTTSPLKRWKKKIGVKVFRTRDGFGRYQRESGSSLGESAVGYYSLQHKELVLYYDPNNPAETLNTLFHEGTHLFTHLAFGEKYERLPIWLSEGLAEYFGPSRLKPGKKKDLEFGLPSYGRLREAREVLLRQTPSLKGDVLAFTDYANFGPARYALSWALVHMLIEKERGRKGKHKYRARLVKYVEQVIAGQDPVAAFERVVGPISVIEDEWLSYIKSFRLPPLEEGLALMRRGDFARATPLLEVHAREQPKDPVGHYALGECYLGTGKLSQAVESLRRATVANPDYADAFCSLAYALISLSRPRQAIAPAERAVSISPTGLNHYMLALAASRAGLKAKALKSIDQAIRLLGRGKELLDLKAEIERR